MVLDLLIWHIHDTITQLHAIQILVITLGLGLLVVVVVLLNLLANLHVGQCTKGFAQ